jgi:hypothetical protein
MKISYECFGCMSEIECNQCGEFSGRINKCSNCIKFLTCKKENNGKCKEFVEAKGL